MHETFIGSVAPLRVSLRRGRAMVVKRVTTAAGNADPVDVLGHLVTVTADDGTCPPGTVGVADFDARTADAQNAVVVSAAHTQRGHLPITINTGGFLSANKRSPARCTALITASGPAGDTDATNNTTTLVIDVLDANSF